MGCCALEGGAEVVTHVAAIPLEEAAIKPCMMLTRKKALATSSVLGGGSSGYRGEFSTCRFRAVIPSNPQAIANLAQAEMHA